MIEIIIQVGRYPMIGYLNSTYKTESIPVHNVYYIVVCNTCTCSHDMYYYNMYMYNYVVTDTSTILVKLCYYTYYTCTCTCILYQSILYTNI